MIIEIIRLVELPLASIRPIQVESRAEGFTFVDRFIDGYVSGVTRFDGPGEVLFGVYVDDDLIAIGGLSRDPYLNRPDVGRVRHLYVLADWRRQGVGADLMARIIDEARLSFALLTLRTFSAEADCFYRRIGFATEPKFESATHHFDLTDC